MLGLPRVQRRGGPAPTSGQRIDLRWLLHGIQRGRDLDDPAAFVAVGQGQAAYPNDFTARTFEGVHFPVDPGESANCAKCHGSANVIWRDSCGACHDSPAAGAHVDSHTAPDGVESCAICHGPGEAWSMERMHKGY
jgi:hypothetical protein